MDVNNYGEYSKTTTKGQRMTQKTGRPTESCLIKHRGIQNSQEDEYAVGYVFQLITQVKYGIQ